MNIKLHNHIPIIIIILKINVNRYFYECGMLFSALSKSRIWKGRGRETRQRRTRFDEFSVSTVSSSVYRSLDEVSSIAERWSMPSRQIRLLRTNDRTFDRLIVQRTRRTDWFRFKQRYHTWLTTLTWHYVNYSRFVVSPVESTTSRILTRVWYDLSSRKSKKRMMKWRWNVLNERYKK